MTVVLFPKWHKTNSLRAGNMNLNPPEVGKETTFTAGVCFFGNKLDLHDYHPQSGLPTFVWW